jgi:hypothetical protein
MVALGRPPAVAGVFSFLASSFPGRGSARQWSRPAATAFAGWEMLASEPADTVGLGWPITKTAPRS